MITAPSAELEASGPRLAWFFALAYLLLILYASLTPFAGWRAPAGDPFAFLTAPWPRYWTAFDLTINAVAYLPLGLLLTLALINYVPRDVALLTATLAGGAVSLGLEFAQGYLPGRISSNLDSAMNLTGTFLGAMIAVRTGSLDFVSRRFMWLRSRFRPGVHADIGLALLALWFASQLNPSLPLLGNVAIRVPGGSALRPDYAQPAFSILEMGAAMFTLLAVGLMLAALVRKPWQALVGTTLLALTAGLIKLAAGFLLLRPEARFQWLSREVWMGAASGLALLGLFLLTSERWRRLGCTMSLLTVIALTQIFARDANHLDFLRLFNWHYGQLLNFTGLAHTVGTAWPFLALVWLFLGRKPRRDR
ncbi:MAG TPA: VanZ family protein [Burkholderiales bacterium]|nr:VanZ family protein [Betaproteobacteria bacterium]HQR53861.1 VanZ family protein [Burkholderiales bacterium]